ncbi:MAG: hypothetical protein HPY85_02660 [Anaerolineae bacterium]|nr:hypothetical protein [Anaerolineae bacterium]
MSRVINPETAGKQRKILLRGVVLAIRTLMQQKVQDELSRDLAAFIGLALLEIYETVNASVAAWEKRDYWVKADRYRMEWRWTEQYGKPLCEAVLQEDWAVIPGLIAQIAQRVMTVDLPQRHRLGEPWIGAWEQLQDTYPSSAR